MPLLQLAISILFEISVFNVANKVYNVIAFVDHLLLYEILFLLEKFNVYTNNFYLHLIIYGTRDIDCNQYIKTRSRCTLRTT